MRSPQRSEGGRLASVTAGLLLLVGPPLSRGAPAAAAGPRPEPDRAGLLDPRHELWSRRAPEVFRARLETSQGAFVVEVRRGWAPHGADRFHGLVAAGFFDGSRFFRVVPGFVAQFGIPGDPAVTARWKDRTIPDDPVRESNLRGTIAYAMTGPDTRSTQLYVNLKDNPRLDAQGFAPIGHVVSGMDVVDRLYGGYGETAGGGMRGGRQGPLLAGGNAYLDARFPKLDRLLRARILDSFEHARALHEVGVRDRRHGSSPNLRFGKARSVAECMRRAGEGRPILGSCSPK